MSSKHTPGPWSHCKGGLHNFFYIDSPSGDVVYVTGSLQPDHVEANARLIAAAPDLLMKLTGLIGATEYLQARVVETRGADCMDNLDVAIDEARAAIAKATGEA